MTTLSASKPRTYELGDQAGYPVKAATVIYEGAAVGLDGSGNARPLVSGDPFLGFAETKIDNTTGAAGALNIQTRKRGSIVLPVATIQQMDVGRPVYATDDDTFTVGGIGTRIGILEKRLASGVGLVTYDVVRSEQDFLLSVPITLASITANGDVVTNFTPGFWGRIKSVAFAVLTPVTTAAKRADLNLEVGTANLTGGVVSITSAAATPLGALIAGSAITANNVFGPTDTISVEAANVTAHAEGSGVLLIAIGR